VKRNVRAKTPKVRSREGVNQAQHDRLATLTADTKVIGLDNGCPVVRYPNGRLMKVGRTGRMVSVSKRAEQEIVLKQIGRANGRR